MGAWGSGSFENDTALDWAAGVQSLDDVRKPFERLKHDTDGHEGPGELVVDADFACELLAAAECVAALLGRRGRDFPDDLAERLTGAGEPDKLLFHQARNAVLHVLRHSELAELWEESATAEDGNAWIAELTGLIDRLNPELPPPDIFSSGRDTTGEDPAQIVGTCALCNGPIQRKDLWGLRFYDAYDPGRAGRKEFWVHLPCANARFHHKFAVADFKFDPDNMPDLDKL
jgi:hypothetical protein